jgi:uncharacterized Tic20 family protein
MKNEYTQEERLLAGLAHASIITGVIGLVAGLLIYITQKEKSAYTARQALQAVFYQLIGTIVALVAWSCWGAFYALSFIPLITNPDQYQDAPPPIFWVGLGSVVLPLVVMAIWGLYGLYGAVQAWRGKEFQYAFIGRLKILS